MEIKASHQKKTSKGLREEKAWKRRFCKKRKKGKSVKRSPERNLSAEKKNNLEEGSAKKEKQKRM